MWNGYVRKRQFSWCAVAEARASLPDLDTGIACYPNHVQAAMALQWMRLRQDQGVPGWCWRP